MFPLEQKAVMGEFCGKLMTQCLKWETPTSAESRGNRAPPKDSKKEIRQSETPAPALQPPGKKTAVFHTGTPICFSTDKTPILLFLVTDFSASHVFHGVFFLRLPLLCWKSASKRSTLLRTWRSQKLSLIDVNHQEATRNRLKILVHSLIQEVEVFDRKRRTIYSHTRAHKHL